MVKPLGDYGLSLVVENDRKNGVEVLRLALILDPDQAKLLNNLAWALVSVPDVPPYDPPQALEAIRKAVSLEPDNWLYWNTLGVAAYRAGDWKTAVEALEKSMSLNEGRRGGRLVLPGHDPLAAGPAGRGAEDGSTGPWNGRRRTRRATPSSSGSRQRPRRSWGSPRSPRRRSPPPSS